MAGAVDDSKINIIVVIIIIVFRFFVLLSIRGVLIIRQSCDFILHLLFE